MHKQLTKIVQILLSHPVSTLATEAVLPKQIITNFQRTVVYKMNIDKG